MKIGRSVLIAGRALLIAIMLLTVVPFVSIFTTALYPSGTMPDGLSLPPKPQWGNFVEAFKVANMARLLASSTYALPR